MSQRDILTRLSEQLRAIRHGRYNRIDPATESPELRPVIEELNKVGGERARLLADNEARYRLIINSTPIAICITDETGLYEYTNPEYRRLTRYSESELIGQHFSLVVPEDDRETLTELHDECMGRRAELEGQWKIVHKDGHEISILANAAHIIDTDDRAKKVTYVVDISELTAARQNLEEEIEKRKLTEQIRDQVERVMRHDLRNPLDGIQTAAEFLLMEEQDPRRRDFIDLKFQASQHAREQIDNSLAYARMQRGTCVLHRVRINLVQLLRDVMTRVEVVRAAYDVNIRMGYNGGDWSTAFDIELWGERGFIADATANLIRNAIEASERGGTVRIEVTDTETSDTGVAEVVISVHNAHDMERRTAYEDHLDWDWNHGGSDGGASDGRGA